MVAPTSPSLSRHNTGLRTTSPQWHNIFKQKVEKNDPLWKQYVEEAAPFDNRMIDEWNKVIDVVLVYAALLSAVLTSFAIQTSSQLQPDPVHISNQLLVALYNNQLAALQNSSPYIINTTHLFQQDPGDHQAAVISNAILFTGLSSAVMVSIIALFAKLWVITYSSRVNSAGSLYQRAKRRQKAYSGVLAWRLDTVINVLPFMLLVAVVTFGVFIVQATGPSQQTVGKVVWAMFNIGLYFLVLVSMAAAFIPTCPFHSSLSTILKLPFKLLEWIGLKFPKYNGNKFALYATSVAISMASCAMAILAYIHSFYLAFLYFPFITAGSLWHFGCAQGSDKRPKLGVHQWVLVGSIVTTPYMLMMDFTGTIVVYIWPISTLLSTLWLLYGLTFILSNGVPNTWKSDAIAWLLKSTSSPKPSLFRKAGQIAEGSEHRKAFLLTSLLPLLSPLIISLDRQEETDESCIQNPGTYIGCLAQLSAFTDHEDSFWKNEAALQHPLLPNAELLVETLKQQGDSSDPHICSATKEILQRYKVGVQLSQTELP